MIYNRGRFATGINYTEPIKTVKVASKPKPEVIRVDSLNELDKRGFVVVGHGIRKDAKHFLWSIEKDGDTFLVKRSMDEEGNPICLQAEEPAQITASKTSAYGDKRDYRKIDIYVDGTYKGSTNWAANLKEAKDKFIERNPQFANSKIQVGYSDGQSRTIAKNKTAIWKGRLQKQYEDFEEFQGYDRNYGLVERLGFESAEEAWEANPMIQGGVNPEDYKVVKASKKSALTLWKRPSNYMGEEFNDYYVGPGQSRDSDILEKANFEAALTMLGGENEPDVIVEHATHWAVDYVEQILVHKDSDKVAILEDIESKLESYPVLDDDLYSNMQHEEYEQDYESWAKSQAIETLELEETEDGRYADEEGYSITEDGLHRIVYDSLSEGYSLREDDLKKRYDDEKEHKETLKMKELEDLGQQKLPLGASKKNATTETSSLISESLKDIIKNYAPFIGEREWKEQGFNPDRYYWFIPNDAGTDWEMGGFVSSPEWLGKTYYEVEVYDRVDGKFIHLDFSKETAPISANKKALRKKIAALPEDIKSQLEKFIDEETQCVRGYDEFIMNIALQYQRKSITLDEYMSILSVVEAILKEEQAHAKKLINLKNASKKTATIYKEEARTILTEQHDEDAATTYKVASKKTAATMPNEIISIWDNGGETVDRYTIMFDETYGKGAYLGLDDKAGRSFSQWGEGAEEGEHLGEEVSWEDLSTKTQEHIIYRLHEGETKEGSMEKKSAVEWEKEAVAAELYNHFNKNIDEDDTEALEALLDEINESLDLDKGYSNLGDAGTVTVDGTEYNIIEDEDEAERIAIDLVKNDLETEPSMFTQDWLQSFITISDTDKRMMISEEEDNIRTDIEDDADKMDETDDELEIDTDDLHTQAENIAEEKEFDSEEEKEEWIEEHYEELLEKALEDARKEYVEKEVSDRLSDFEQGLEDPVDYFVNQQGIYSVEDLMKANFIMIDIDAAAEEVVSMDGWAMKLSHVNGDYSTTANGLVFFEE